MKTIKDIIGDRTLIASISGGGDSAAMALHFKELGLPYKCVFADTGWEHPATIEYINGPLTDAIGPIETVRAEKDFKEFALHYGVFPYFHQRWCTENLKLRPLRQYVKRLQDEVGEVVMAIGIRHEESSKRAKMIEWEFNQQYDADIWRPILSWTEKDRAEIHARHGLLPNPLYLKGAKRVGCFPCIFAKKPELLLVEKIWPERIDEIRALEAMVTVSAQIKKEAKGEQLLHPRTLLRERRPGLPANIDGQMQWAHSGQTDLFEVEDPGCARWGLCEKQPEEA